jgi:hypothetical protein
MRRQRKFGDLSGKTSGHDNANAFVLNVVSQILSINAMPANRIKILIISPFKYENHTRYFSHWPKLFSTAAENEVKARRIGAPFLSHRHQ